MPHRTWGERSPPRSNDFDQRNGIDMPGSLDSWRQSVSWMLMSLQFKLDRLTDMHQDLLKETAKEQKPAGEPMPWAKLAREFTIMVVAVLVAFLIFKDKLKPADVVRPIDIGEVAPWKK